HAHGSLSSFARKKGGLKKIAYSPFLFFMLFFSSAIIFSNEEEKRHSKLNKKSIYIPNLIDTMKFHGKRNDSAVNKNKFVYVGKIDYAYKAIDVMLTGFSNFSSNTSKNYSLHIYGYGKYKNFEQNNIMPDDTDVLRLVSDIDKLNQNNIHFHGPITNDHLPNILVDSGALLLLSRSEAMPLVISEALSCGVPVLISKQTNMGKYVSDSCSGIVVDTFDEKTIELGFEQYDKLSDDDWCKMSENAKLCSSNVLSGVFLKKFISDFILEVGL
ncbi:glycosyltransferase, partial [Escherichia coli]